MLASLELTDALVSIDAIGCQQAIVEQIVTQKGQYLIELKANQHALFEQVLDWMLRYLEQPAHYTERSLDRGRAELRDVWVSRELTLLDTTADWAALNTVVMLRNQRWQGEQASTMIRFYSSSLKEATVSQLAGYSRHHRFGL